MEFAPRGVYLEVRGSQVVLSIYLESSYVKFIVADLSGGLELYSFCWIYIYA